MNDQPWLKQDPIMFVDHFMILLLVDSYAFPLINIYLVIKGDD